MKYAFKPEILKEYCHWAFYTGVFKPEECEKLVSLMNPEEAKISDGVNKKVRSASITWLKPDNPEALFAFKRLDQLANFANKAHWRYQLSGFYEPLQLTEYKKNQFYNVHQDIGHSDMSIRKLSMVVQLTDPKKYKGGQLIFAGMEHCQDKVPTAQGSVIVFPSFQPHSVSKITSGKRHSLVAWVSGEPFR